MCLLLTRQPVRVIKQYIYLDVYVYDRFPRQYVNYSEKVVKTLSRTLSQVFSSVIKKLQNSIKF
jgi:hypothetical protein